MLSRRRQEEKVKYRGRVESGEVKCSCKYWFQVRKVCKVNIIKNLLTIYKFYKTYFSEYLQDGGRFILGQSGQEAKNVHMDSFTAPTSARLSLSWVDMSYNFFVVLL